MKVKDLPLCEISLNVMRERSMQREEKGGRFYFITQDPAVIRNASISPMRFKVEKGREHMKIRRMVTGHTSDGKFLPCARPI